MRLLAALVVFTALVVAAAPLAAAPEGQMTWGVHVSLAPTWFDPAETPGIGTPFMILYALHDALVKPMPGNAMAPSLAESWTLSKDGLVYEFIDGLFREQAGELDRKRREAALHRIQQLVYDKAVYAPIWELGFIHAQGPRVAESGLGLITGWAFSAPYEDLKLKSR